jgi:hypothetical protein
MAIAGRVAIVPKGDWSADATYKRLDAVTHNNTLYFAKKDVPAGTATSNTEYWSKSIVGGASAIATTEDAGVVKPDGKSMSVDESGTLSINLDGTTITLDEAKNVIKLADALKDKIGSALQPESIVNNQVTTENGFALDARQANPNLDGTLAKQISDLNGSLNNNRDIIWSSPHTLTPSVINKWVASDNFITLQPGKYILGLKAHAVCNSDVYIDTSIDTKEQSFIFYEKNVNMPVSTITAGETGVTRSVTNVFVATIDAPIELYFLCYTSATITITYEIWALKLL